MQWSYFVRECFKKGLHSAEYPHGRVGTARLLLGPCCLFYLIEILIEVFSMKLPTSPKMDASPVAMFRQQSYLVGILLSFDLWFAMLSTALIGGETSDLLPTPYLFYKIIAPS